MFAVVAEFDDSEVDVRSLVPPFRKRSSVPSRPRDVIRTPAKTRLTSDAPEICLDMVQLTVVCALLSVVLLMVTTMAGYYLYKVSSELAAPLLLFKM